MCWDEQRRLCRCSEESHPPRICCSSLSAEKQRAVSVWTSRVCHRLTSSLIAHRCPNILCTYSPGESLIPRVIRFHKCTPGRILTHTVHAHIKHTCMHAHTHTDETVSTSTWFTQLRSSVLIKRQCVSRHLLTRAVGMVPCRHPIHTHALALWWSTETGILSGKSMLVLLTHFEYWTARFSRQAFDACRVMHEVRGELLAGQVLPTSCVRNRNKSPSCWNGTGLVGKSGSHWQHGFRNSVKLTWVDH